MSISGGPKVPCPPNLMPMLCYHCFNGIFFTEVVYGIMQTIQVYEFSEKYVGGWLFDSSCSRNNSFNSSKLAKFKHRWNYSKLCLRLIWKFNLERQTRRQLSQTNINLSNCKTRANHCEWQLTILSPTTWQMNRFMSSPFNSDNDDMCSLLQQAYEHHVFHYDLFNRLHFMSQSTISHPSNLLLMHTERRNFVNQYFPDKQAKAYYWLNHHHHHQCRNRSRIISIVVVSVSSAHISVFFINKSFAIRVESPFPSPSAFSQSIRVDSIPFRSLSHSQPMFPSQQTPGVCRR